MKNKWLKIIAIIVVVGMITAPAFAMAPVADPPPPAPDPPPEPDPSPAITAPRSNPEGCTSGCFTGVEADKQMRAVTGYITPIEEKLPVVEEKPPKVEEPTPKPIPVRELLRSFEDSSM